MVVISHSKMFIFIHAPKTAGNSIQNILKKYSDDTILEKNGSRRQGSVLSKFEVENFAGNKHSPISSYIGRWNDNFASFESFFKFGVVRNPWSRMISFYFHINPQPDHIFDRDLFINIVEGNIGSKMQLKSFRHHYFHRGKLMMDKVLRFENLQNDFNEACKLIGIPVEELPHVNKSQHRDLRQYYDDELVAKVGEIYASDIEKFDYCFD